MNIYVRPLATIDIEFYSNNASEASNFKIQIRTGSGEMDWADVTIGEKRQWASEDGTSLKLRIQMTGTTDMNRVSCQVKYMGHDRVFPRQPITSAGEWVQFNDTLVIDPTVSPCRVYINFYQAFELEAFLYYPSDVWSSGANALKLVGNRVVTADGETKTALPDTLTAGQVHYTFEDTMSTEGRSQITITGGCPLKQIRYPSESGSEATTLLCDSTYKQVINPTTGNARYSNRVLSASVEGFSTTKYTLSYSCSESSKIKFVVYQPPVGTTSTGWPTSMNNVSGWTVVQTWTPSEKTATATFESNTSMPILCFRVMQITENGSQTTLDFFNKLNITLNVKQNGATVKSFHIAEDYMFNLTNQRYFDIYPTAFQSKFSDFSNYFKADVNGTYEFTMDCTLESAYELNMYISRIDFKKNDAEASADHVDINASDTSIGKLLPGNQRTGDTGTNLTLYVTTDQMITPGTGTGKHLQMYFVDTDGTDAHELTVMYPSSSEISGPTATSPTGAGPYVFEAATKRSDIWVNEQTPLGKRYTSDSEYKILLKYTDSDFAGMAYNKLIGFHIQPVFKIWFTSSEFMIDDSGEATVQFCCHVTNTETTRYPDPAVYPGDPELNWPAVGTALTAQQWNNGNRALEMPLADSNLRFTYMGHRTIDLSETDIIKITGAQNFQSSLEITASVLNQTTSVKVSKFMQLTSIKWWDGQSVQTASSVSEARLSPVAWTGAVVIGVKFKENHGLNFDGRMSFATTDRIFHQGLIVGTVVKAASETQDLTLSVHVNNTLGIINDGLTDDPIYYTGMTVPFTLTVPRTSGDDFVYTFDLTLGPVIALHDGTPLGNTLKPQLGEKTITQTRGHEWYYDTTENKIMMTANAVEGTHQGHTYAVTWTYNDTAVPGVSTPDMVQSDDLISGESSYRYENQYQNTWLKIQHAASWTGDKRYYHDGGAWRIEVISTDNIPDNAKLEGKVTVTDASGAAHSLHHWYDSGKTTTVDVIEGYKIIGARYLNYLDYSDSQDVKPVYEDCTSNWKNGLRLMSVNAQAYSTNSFEIFIQAQEGGTFYFDLMTSVSGHSFEDLFNVNILVPTGGGTYNG